MTNFLSGKKKILTMILGIVSGLAIAFGMEPNEVNVIAGAVVAVVSTASYLIVEGRIDVERIKSAAVAVNDAIDLIGGFDEYEDEAFDAEDDDATGQEETGQGGDVNV